MIWGSTYRLKLDQIRSMALLMLTQSPKEQSILHCHFSILSWLGLQNLTTGLANLRYHESMKRTSVFSWPRKWVHIHVYTCVYIYNIYIYKCIICIHTCAGTEIEDIDILRCRLYLDIRLPHLSQTPQRSIQRPKRHLHRRRRPLKSLHEQSKTWPAQPWLSQPCCTLKWLIDR